MADCPTACTSPAGPLGVRTMSQSKVAPSSNELEPRKAVVAPACPPQKSACCPGTGEDPSSKTIPLNTPNASSISGLSAVHRVASSFQGQAPYAFITGSRRVQIWESKSFTTKPRETEPPESCGELFRDLAEGLPRPIVLGNEIRRRRDTCLAVQIPVEVHDEGACGEGHAVLPPALAPRLLQIGGEVF